MRKYRQNQVSSKTQEVLKRIKEMSRYLTKGSREVQPSKLWQHLTNLDIKELKENGYENFKRTLVRHYSAYVPMCLMNTQILFLITHLNPLATMVALYESLTMPTHDCFNWIDSAGFNFITYLLWFYTEKVDQDKLLDNFEESLLGNPPKIIYQNKLISQDMANSVLEFKSIFDDKVEKKDIKTIADLGAGCGRDASVFIRLLPGLRKYLIIDIAPALAIAERYLSELFPREKIFKFRPFKDFSEVKEEFKKSKILFFLPNQIELLPDNIVDLFINVSSLHEMRLDQIKYYFKQIERLTKLKGYFYFKEFKDSYIAYEDVHIKSGDYPINPKWKVVYLREAKVQTKFFEALVRLKKK
jgi:putative sugar O-methyltransferase